MVCAVLSADKLIAPVPVTKVKLALLKVAVELSFDAKVNAAPDEFPIEVVPDPVVLIFVVPVDVIPLGKLLLTLLFVAMYYPKQNLKYQYYF
jgi:hypothetical protein